MIKREMLAAEQFVERLGLLIEAEGLPRIAGRILGFMLTSSGPCRGSDLASQLRISHGSVSTNTRLLERFGILERVTFPGERADYFQLTADPFGQLLEGVVDRARRVHTIVTEFRRSDADIHPEARRRLLAMERFYKLWIATTEELRARWKSKDAVAISA